MPIITDRGHLVINGITDRGRLPVDRAEIVFGSGSGSFFEGASHTGTSGSANFAVKIAFVSTSNTSTVVTGEIHGARLPLGSATSQTISTAKLLSLSSLDKRGWSSQYKDVNSTKRTPTVSNADGSIRFRLTFENVFVSDGGTPLITPTGNVFLTGTSQVGLITPFGTPIWGYGVGGQPFGYTPAFGDDGMVYVPVASKLDCRKRDTGELIWTFDTRDLTGELDHYIISHVVIFNGTIYFAAREILEFFTGGRNKSAVFAVNPNGTLKWKFAETVDNFYQWTSYDIAVSKIDGTIYLQSYTKVYAINPDGSLKWTFNTAEQTDGHFFLVSPYDGTIYVGTIHGIYAINPDGSQKWYYSISFGSNWTYYMKPVMDSEGTLYFHKAVHQNFPSSWTDAFVALKPNMAVKWTFALPSQPVGGGPETLNGDMVIDGSDTIYWVSVPVDPTLTGAPTIVHAIRSSDGSGIWSTNIAEYRIGEMSIGDDGTIYLNTVVDTGTSGTYKRMLYSFGSPLAVSPVRCVALYSARTQTYISPTLAGG